MTDFQITTDIRSSEENNCLYAEASEIGLEPGQVPNTLIYEGRAYRFCQPKTAANAEIYAWEYRDWLTLRRIVIWND